MKLDIRPYRLRFKRPFGTAHGLRDGTDSVLVRVNDGRFVGHGEATTPPYVGEDQTSILHAYEHIDTQSISIVDFISMSKSVDALLDAKDAPAARAGLHMAFTELMMSMPNHDIKSIFKVSSRGAGNAIYTLGIGMLDQLNDIASEIPEVAVLKIKLEGQEGDIDIVRQVTQWTKRPLLLDANQGMSSVGHALAVVQAAGGPDRVLGLEQPFDKDDLGAHAALIRESPVPVIADESIQGVEDLEERGRAFTGVNIKLMKCGGLDKAMEMALWVRRHGKLVMLGSMSESSLGCAAMASLAGFADLCDLDGPWLIANDPFDGFGIEGGRYRGTGPSGFGVVPRAGLFNSLIGT